MMKKKKAILSLLITTSNFIYSQTFVNKEWNTSTGEVGSINRTSSVLDSNNDLIVVSNTLNIANNTDVLITKYNSVGTLLWQSTFNGVNNGDDYAIKVIVNSVNEIYVASTIFGTISNDFGLLKYSSAGILIWANTWNGYANRNDIPSDIDIDDLGNIYLVGSSEASNNLSDYGVVKFTSSGLIGWSYIYDYNNLHDAASSLKLINNTLIVTGASASTSNEWDFATLQIDAFNGYLINTERTIINGVGLDNALAVTTDINNNIYITGYVIINGNTNIQTVKLNNNFNLEWVKNFDGGFEDISNAIGIDNFGNIYITGSSENKNGGKDCITIKYNNAGVELWTKKFGASGGTNLVKGEKLVIDDSGNIIIAGTYNNNKNKDFVTLKYDIDGKRKFSKTFDAGNQDDEAKSISINNNDIYVSGISKISAQKQNSTIKYSIREKPIEIASLAGIPYNKNEVIIRFDKSQIKYSAIDNKNFLSGNLSDFVKTSGLHELSQSTEMNWSNFPTFKIHKRMTSADSISISRSGKKIRLPAHWASLSIFIPNNLDIALIINSINNNLLKIQYAEKNYFYSPTNFSPNDTLYKTDNQKGLNGSLSFPFAGINLDSAWKFQVGKSYVKVGVIDDPIYWAHEDFGDSTFAGSKVKGGWDYYTDDSIKHTHVPLQSSHGTACAGIIGALSNNKKGIAGIAGGDVLNGNSGVSLYSFGVNLLDTTYFDGASIVCAILEASCSNPESNFGYGLHIQNNSYGSSGFSLEGKNAVETSWRNECVFVASRGNDGIINDYEYPACFSDKMVISVGASGRDGQDAYGSSNGMVGFFPSYGKNMDFIAPGVNRIVSVPYYYGKLLDITTIVGCNVNVPEYGCFNGTSASAPHATGVVALLLSQHNVLNWYNNNLAPEDVEYLLENSATDKGIDIGYDEKTGWGLLNAGNAMKQITGNYRVEHNSIGTTDTTNIGTSLITTTKEFNSVPAGTYTVKKVSVKITYNELLGSNAIIDTFWFRQSSFMGFGLNTSSISNDYSSVSINSNLISSNNLSVTSFAYCYYIPSIDKWIPDLPENIRTPFSMHVFDTDWTPIEEINEDAIDFNLYPNPTKNILNISYNLNQIENLNIEVFNNLGQLVFKNKFYRTKKSIKTINVSTYDKGIYYVKLYTEDIHKVKKVIIN